MAWIEVHQQLVSHPKVLDVADDLEICAPQAIGHLLCLWMWALEYAEDGDLSRFSIRRIEGAAQWPGEPGALVEALQRRGWLDEWRIHDWWEYAGKLVERRRADAERKAEARRGGQAERQPAAARAPASQAAARPEEEVRDETAAPAETSTEGAAAPSAEAVFVSGGCPGDVRGMSGGRPGDVRRNTTTTKQYSRVPNKTRDKPPPPPDASDEPREVGDGGEGVVVAVGAGDVLDRCFDLAGIQERSQCRDGWRRVRGEEIGAADVLAWHLCREAEDGRLARKGGGLGVGAIVARMAAGGRAGREWYVRAEEELERWAEEELRQRDVMDADVAAPQLAGEMSAGDRWWMEVQGVLRLRLMAAQYNQVIAPLMLRGWEGGTLTLAGPGHVAELVRERWHDLVLSAARTVAPDVATLQVVAV